MWKGQLGKGPGVVAAVLDGLAETEGATDDESDMAFAVGAQVFYILCELFGAAHFAVDFQGDDMTVWVYMGEDALPFFILYDGGVFAVDVVRCFFVGDFDDLQLGVAGESFFIFVDALF